MKSEEEIMEILEAYDLTGSLRMAAELSGCTTTPSRATWLCAKMVAQCATVERSAGK